MDVGEERYTLTWAISPENFLEGQKEIASAGFTVMFEKGAVIAEGPGAGRSAREAVQQLEPMILASVWAAQLCDRRRARLGEPSISRVGGDGRRGYVLVAQAAVMVVALTEHASIVAFDTDGNVVRDTKAELRQAKEERGDLVRQHLADPTIMEMLRSFSEAFADRERPLSRLYDVRDALMKQLGGTKAQVQALLAIDPAEWTEFGDLANRPGLRQGRHPGKDMTNIHDASSEELKRASEIVGGWIVKYLEHLAGGTTPAPAP